MSAAIFDLDNTLIRGSSLFHFGIALARRRELPLRSLLRFSAAEFRFAALRSESGVVRERVVESALSLVRGRRQSEILEHCRSEVPGILERCAVPEVVAELRHHQSAGRRTVLVTATPVELALTVGVQLGFTDVVGTRSHVVQGRYSGALSGPVMHGEMKRRALEALLGPVVLDHAFAYSDSSTDLPLLSMVRFPVAVNADRRLRSIAAAAQWRVMDTRWPPVSGRLSPRGCPPMAVSAPQS